MGDADGAGEGLGSDVCGSSKYQITVHGAHARMSRQLLSWLRMDIRSLVACTKLSPRFTRIYSYHRPSTGEVELVHTELLLPVSIADACIDVVVIKHRAHTRVVHNALTSRLFEVLVACDVMVERVGTHTP